MLRFNTNLLKDTTIRFRLTKQEKEELFEKVDGKIFSNLTEYILYSTLKKVPDKSINKMYNVVNSISIKASKVDNNINQIAFFINRNKSIDKETLEYYNGLLNDLLKNRKELNETISSILKEIKSIKNDS